MLTLGRLTIDAQRYTLDNHDDVGDGAAGGADVDTDPAPRIQPEDMRSLMASQETVVAWIRTQSQNYRDTAPSYPHRYALHFARSPLGLPVLTCRFPGPCNSNGAHIQEYRVKTVLLLMAKVVVVCC
jgi:hypothetical protein